MTRQIAGAIVALMTFTVGLASFSPIAGAQHSDISVYRNADDRVVTVGSTGVEQNVFIRSFDFFGHPFGNTSLPRVYAGVDPGFVAGSAPAGFGALPGSSNVSIDFLSADFGSGSGNLFY